MEPWIFMCLSWFSVFWHFASRLESQRIFSTFCRLEKEATGPEEGLIPQHTHTHTHTRTHTLTQMQRHTFPFETCALGWPLHMDALHMCTSCYSAMLCVNFSLPPPLNFFFPLVTFRSAAQSEISQRYCFRGSRLVDICALIMSLHLWLLMSCLCEMRLLAKDCVSSNDTAEGISTRRRRVYQLCPNIWFSLRCEHERVAELSALPHSRGPLGKWMGLI